MCAFAQVIITEVMYDVEGSDTDREWVEVFNSGSGAVDLSAWKLFEANSSHTITPISGGNALASGAYAVITDNAPTFLTDHPSFSGQLFDSTFSLSNTGETLALHDANGNEKDSLAYTAGGAAGDGNTLQRTSITSAALVAAVASPGSGVLTVSGIANTTANNTSSDTQSIVPPQEASGGGLVEPQIIAYAGKDRAVVVGADALFDGEAFTKSGEPLEPKGIRFLWNFGDGKIAEGSRVRHAWTHPGRYVLTLDVSASKNNASHRIIVTAKPALLAVSTLEDGSMVVENKNDNELDLSFWHVRSGEHLFTIPEDTVVLVKEKIIIPPESLGFKTGLDVTLLYPNGEVASTVPPPKPFIAHVVADTPAPTVATAPKTVAAKIAPQQTAAAVAALVSAESPAKALEFSPWAVALLILISCGAVGAYAVTRANRNSFEIKEITE